MSEELLCVGCGIKLQCEDEAKEMLFHVLVFFVKDAIN